MVTADFDGLPLLDDVRKKICKNHLERFDEEIEKSITKFLTKKYPDYKKWQDVNDIPPVIKEEMLEKGKLIQPAIEITGFCQKSRMIFFWEQEEVFTVIMTTYPFSLETIWADEYSEQERG